MDTVVLENIDELWNLDMGDSYFAGVIETGKSKPEKPYINAGVMMINLKKLREDKMDDALVKALNTQKYKFADQDCINSLCSDKFLLIPSTYNLNDWTESCKNPKIRHFANESKWWENIFLFYYRNNSWNKMRDEE